MDESKTWDKIEARIDEKNYWLLIKPNIIETY
jgi:hypothetical protein